MRRALLVLALLLAACSSDDPSADARFDRDALPTLADLGRGWRAAPVPSGPTLAELCPGSRKGEPTGRAHSNRFLRQQETLAVAIGSWPDPTAAGEDLRWVSADDTAQCAAHALERAAETRRPTPDSVRVRATAATVKAWGDERAAVHTSLVLRWGSSTRQFDYSVVYVRVDRHVVQFIFSASPGPAVPDHRIVELVLRRLEGERTA